MKNRIKELRKALEKTLIEFGEEIGVSHAAVSDWERGKRNAPESIRRQICTHFHVNRDWLETGRGEMFVDEKSPEQLDREAFTRVALRLYESVPDDLRGALVDVARGIIVGEDARRAQEKDAAPEKKKARRGRPPKNS